MVQIDDVLNGSRHLTRHTDSLLTDGDPAFATTSVDAAASASSYVLEGPRWASSTVTWSFENVNYAQDSANPFSSAISGPYQSTITQALARWASVSGLSFVQVPDSATASQAADIRIGFGTLNTQTTNEVGYTSYSYTVGATGSEVLTTDTLVRLEDPSQDPLQQASNGSLMYQGFSTNLYQTVLHELGHALGLAHSTDQTSVMFPNLGPGNPDLGATDIAGIQALYGAVAPTPAPAPAPAPTPAPVPPAPSPAPAPAPAPVVIQGGTFGSGSDTLTVSLAEDAYQGDALATITLDGVSLTAQAVSVTALQSNGAQEVFTFKGNFGTGSHVVGVAFLNDAWGGSASTDRNLYLDGVALNGAAVTSGTAQSAGGSPQPVSAPAAMYRTGDSALFTVAGGTNPPSPAPTPTPADILTLHLSEDAWNGDAQFVVSVDGHQLGAAQTVSALHGAGALQDFTYTGTFGLGPHDLAVSFINDAWGGTPNTDRNLYVMGADYDGQHVSGATAALYSNGTTHFQIPALTG